MSRPVLPENRPNAQLDQDAKDARALGLSYGMYSAFCDMGKYKRNYVKEEVIKKAEKKKKEEKANVKEN